MDGGDGVLEQGGGVGGDPQYGEDGDNGSKDIALDHKADRGFLSDFRFKCDQQRIDVTPSTV